MMDDYLRAVSKTEAALYFFFIHDGRYDFLAG
jgi:hypothetical protein